MRCVHLDFHTSPDIFGIGERFDKKKFTKTIRDANVELVTVFAKCHHGYTYYPSRVAEMHPHLDFNLLKEEIEAIHEAGAKAPIYITAGWCKKDADEHPEWHQIDFHTGRAAYVGADPSLVCDPDSALAECSWINLCIIGEYSKHLEAITREVAENFDISDGIFYDICFAGDTCICDTCRKNMIAKGLDPTNLDDVRKHYSEGRVELMKRLTGIVHEYAKDAPVFYNGGADMNRTEYHPYQTHYELEDLPTAWGGYDLMPLRAKFFEKYGKPFLGMTGKFHHAWGEFGGFKDKEALRYECADMLSIGASISVGDHLHPSGEIDDSTYRLIGHAFDYVKRIEGYCYNTDAYTDLAIWMSHSSASDIGASKLLQNMHLEYDVVASGDDLDKYSCIIFPDRVRFSDADKEAILKFKESGGIIVASYESVFDELGIEKLSPSANDVDYIRADLDEITTPFLSYSSAYVVRASEEAEVLARVYEPYFNRTHRHFCGHKNTPFKTEPADYPALLRCGNVLYFAHPVFEAYNNSGSYALENYVINAIRSGYSPSIATDGLPSCARVRLRRSKDREFFALHLLYAPPVNRGNVCLLPDFPRLHDVTVTLSVDRSITSARIEPSGECVSFVQEGNRVTLKMPPFSLHALVVLE